MKKTLLATILFSGLQATAQIPTDNLLVHMKFNGNLNEEVSSTSGTAMGNTGSVSYVTDRFGNANYALSLSNSPYGYVELSDINLVDPDYTVSFWIKHTQVPAGKQFRVLSKRETCSNGSFLDITLDANTQNIVFESVALNDNTGSLNEVFVSTSMWSHVAFVVDQANSESYFYLNGSLYATVSWANSLAAGSMDNSASLELGHSPCTNGTNVYGFDGNLDDLYLYSRALNSTEIAALYAEANPTAGIQEENISMNLYPNPTTGSLNIKLSKEASIEITNLSGSVMINSVETKDHMLDVSQLAKGIYMVRTSTGTTTRFVKE